ncbi:Haloacid dehalogenase-like hydrolase [Naviculisporaceae sp. PSN 640]
MGSTDASNGRGAIGGDYTAPAVQVTFDGLLFDMDGTIIDSTAAVEKHWAAIGDDIGVSPEVILQTSHGRRSIDILKILAPEKATWEYVQHMEGRLPKLYGDDAVEIPGARSLLLDLISKSAPWAIVTSGTIPLVTGWLGVLDLPHPEHLITAESVENGKPDPACYNLGRTRLSLTSPDKQVLVFEDSPAGIRSGKAAGCKVIGLVTSHTVEQVLSAEPDWVVIDLSSVKLVDVSTAVGENGKQVVTGITLEIKDAFVVRK